MSRSEEELPELYLPEGPLNVGTSRRHTRHSGGEGGATTPRSSGTERGRGGSWGTRLDRIVADGGLLLLALTALAFGTVEYWSIALFAGMVLLLFLIWGIRLMLRGASAPSFPAILIPLLLFLGWGIVQTFSWRDARGQRHTLSMDPESTWLALEVGALLLVLGVLTSHSMAVPGRIRRIALFLTIFGFALSLFGLVQDLSWNGRYYWILEPSITPSHPFASFVNHNHFAGFVEMIAPIPLAFALSGRLRREQALLAGFAAALMGVAVFASLSRGGMLSLLVGLGVVLLPGAVWRKEEQRSASRLGVVSFLPGLVLVGTIAVGVFWVAADEVIDRIEPVAPAGEEARLGSPPGEVARIGSAFYQNRGFIWADTLRIIRAHWGAGVGLGAYLTAYTRHSEEDRALLIAQAHNDYLQALAEGGVIAGGLILLFLWLLFRAVGWSRDHPDWRARALARGATGGLTAMLVHSLFDFNLQLISNSYLFLTLSVVVWSIGQASVRSRPGRSLSS
jgi:O-antigen ligase